MRRKKDITGTPGEVRYLAGYRKQGTCDVSELVTRICGTEAEYRTSVRKAYGTWTAHVWELGYRPKVSGSSRLATAVSEFNPGDVVGDRTSPTV
jgi:hypothetical protein